MTRILATTFFVFLLLLLALAGGVLAGDDGTTRIVPVDGVGAEARLELVVVCSSDRFPISRATANPRDAARTALYDYINQVVEDPQKPGRRLFKCTPGGASLWSTWPDVDIRASCEPSWCAPREP